MFSIRPYPIFLLLLLCSQDGYAETQSIASIQGAISRFINAEFRETQEFEFSVSHIDPRLQLPACPQTLQVFSQRGSLKAGANSIGIHCDGDRKWTIYTVAQIKAFKKVLVLSQPLRRGAILSKRHLTIKSRDIADLRQGYLTAPKLIIGKQAKRNLASGTVINSTHFVEPKLIKRGEKVTIQATSPYFSISMTGIALMDGSKGQPIRVKNIKSKRIIQATVINPGLVSVN